MNQKTKDNLLYLYLGILFIAVVYLLYRVETINTSVKLISSNVNSVHREQLAFKDLIPKNPNAVNYNKVYKVDIGNSVVLGNKNAPVTVIKWTDFQCPYCAKSSSLVTDILNKYPNDVKVVIKNFPLGFHKQAMAAAKYSLAAHKQGKYKEMYYKIFQNYQGLKSNQALPVQYATELGLNMDQFNADFNDPTIQNQINTEMKQLRGTGMKLSVPKFLINGKEPKGRSLDAWSTIIDNELKKAKS